MAITIKRIGAFVKVDNGSGIPTYHSPNATFTYDSNTSKIKGNVEGTAFPETGIADFTIGADVVSNLTEFETLIATLYPANTSLQIPTLAQVLAASDITPEDDGSIALEDISAFTIESGIITGTTAAA